MAFYPINLCLEGKPCLVVGGGAVAERKVQALLQAQAEVTVVAPSVSTGLAGLVQTGQVQWLASTYVPGTAAAYFLVIAATDQQQINAQVAAEAVAAGRLVNAVDDPAAGNFHVPAQLVRGDLVLTVSTGGKSPAFARQLRQELAERYGPEYGRYLEFLEDIRRRMKDSLATAAARESFWRAALGPDILKLLADGHINEAEERIKHAISGVGTQS